MLEQKNLKDLLPGDEFTLFLLVNKSEIKTAKNGRPYLNLELRDTTAILPAKMWDKFESTAKELNEGTVVKVNGQIEEFGGTSQIKIDKIRISKEDDNVSTEDFLPKSKRPIDEMQKELFVIINSIQNPYLKQLLKNIFTENNLDKYLKTPAGKSWHHSYLHGLIEHTLEIVRICELMSTIHSEINRDLLISGALLHDFGKTEELTFETSFDYSDKGKLIGHIMIGALAVEKEASSIPGFPEELKNQLIHLILSHQGKLEFASPVEPKTLEAIVLYQADELSAKTNAYKLAIEVDKNKTGKWTRFLQLANTSLYIPDNKGNFED